MAGTLISFRRWWYAWNLIAPFARRQRSCFWCGAMAALAVVLIRVALPFPLRAAIKPWLPEDGNLTDADTLQTIQQAIWYGLIFFALLACLGLADYRERLSFARFSINLVNDLRAKALAVVARIGPSVNQETDGGDLVARLVGDAARIKAGLKGFLVHVATNGALFIGVAIVLLYIHVALGAIVVAAGIAILAGTCIGASAIHRHAAKYREKEGGLARDIQKLHGTGGEVAEVARQSHASGSHEAEITRIQGWTTWYAHVAYGACVVVAIIVGVHSVQAGHMNAGDFVLFALYALMLRAPSVQLARQGARTGKIVACLERVGEVMALEDNVAHTATNEELPDHPSIELNEVVVRNRTPGRKRRMLGPVSMLVAPGEHVAVVGAMGSGKSTLLRAIHGSLTPVSGAVKWGHFDPSSLSPGVQSNFVTYIPQDVYWNRQSVGSILGLYEETSVSWDDVSAILRALGAKRITRVIRRGLDTKISSRELSPGERRAFLLSRVILNPRPIVLLDDPVAGLETRQVRRTLRTVFRHASSSTIIATFSRPTNMRRFSRVIQLDRGRIAFDGTSEAWRAMQDGDTHRPRDAQAELIGRVRGTEFSNGRSV